MGHPPHGEAGYPDALFGWRAWLVGRLDEEPPVAHLRHDDTEHLVVTPEVVVAPALRLVQPPGALIVGNDPQHCLDIAELSQPIRSDVQQRPAESLDPRRQDRG